MRRETRGTSLESHQSTAPTLLEAAAISKTYRRGVWPRRSNVPVLGSASVRLRAGELVGLVGKNGSGKSTFMKILVAILCERLTADEHFAPFARGYGMTDPRRRTLETTSTPSSTSRPTGSAG